VRIFEAAAIREAVRINDLIDPVAAAFATFSQGLGEAPVVVFAPAGQAGDVHVKSAWLAGRTVFTVKVAAWFAARADSGRSAASGYIAVHDAQTGDLLALLQDEHYLTDVRTAAAGAVATQLLARRSAHRLAVLGTGVQAHLQTLAACAVRPIDIVTIWGRRPAAAHDLRRVLDCELPGVDIRIADNVERAVRETDILITATSSRQAILSGDWLQPGQHVTAVGADDSSKAELDTGCFLRAAVLVVDSRTEAPRHAGDLRRAIDAGVVTEADIDAEIGELVLGTQPGRQDDEQITIAKLIGLGIQDLAAAEVALHRLQSDAPAPSGAPQEHR
jgi:ornithine cyclodeaminase/alanine dehydrogenase-like protein (mu-crystallin family)